MLSKKCSTNSASGSEAGDAHDRQTQKHVRSEQARQGADDFADGSGRVRRGVSRNDSRRFRIVDSAREIAAGVRRQSRRLEGVKHHQSRAEARLRGERL